MVTTSRMIVVLRSDLGRQLALVNKKFIEAKSTQTKVGESAKFYKKMKDIANFQKSIWRLEDVIRTLGSIQLGDIEDNEYEGKF